MSTQTDAVPGSGVIHNIGYRRYDGPRLERFDLIAAMYSQTLRGSYGIGRGIAAKLFPWFLVFCTMLPAFIIVAIQTQIAGIEEPVADFTSYTMYVQVVPILFLAVQAPQAVSRDMRFGTLPLYFSRPLSYADYVLAKFAASWTALFALLAAPLLMLYVGALLVDLPFGQTSFDLLKSLVGAALLAALMTGVGLVIASVTPRRGLGVAAIIAVMMGSYLTTTTIQSALTAFESGQAAAWAGMLSPLTLYDGTQSFLFQVATNTPAAQPDVAPGLALTAALAGFTALCYWLLVLRYRKVSSR
ncbi:MAG: ABC transporter permease [Stackebrandtia sp.]